ncbi:hypothetical protein CLOM_g11590, partial [Closterium sp. NIES-68]
LEQAGLEQAGLGATGAAERDLVWRWGGRMARGRSATTGKNERTNSVGPVVMPELSPLTGMALSGAM